LVWWGVGWGGCVRPRASERARGGAGGISDLNVFAGMEPCCKLRTFPVHMESALG
jgi:hypothetical protein